MDLPPDTTHPDQYACWRRARLQAYPGSAEDMVTVIHDPFSLSAGERVALSRNLARANFAIYRSRQKMGPDAVLALARQAGLTQMEFGLETGSNGITSLKADNSPSPSAYIPFSRKPLNWHTDGYYNPAESRIRSFLLHCRSTAASGGENRLLDHEIAYIQLRDLDPAYIEAFRSEDAMTIPANQRGGAELRPASTGPVFFEDADHRIAMRYTHRTRSISWKSSPVLDRARAALAQILDTSPYVLRYTLMPNEGILCNNILHCRSGFSDSESQSRHLYRIRSFDTVSLDT